MTLLPGSSQRPRPHASGFLDLAALSGFAVSQPVFAELSRATDYLVFVDAGPPQVLTLAIALVVVPPVALWALELLGAAVLPFSRAGLHRFLVSSMLGVVVLQAVGAVTALRPLALIAAAAAGGALLGAVHARWQPAQQWMRLASPAPVVFAALFLFFSPVAGVLRQPGSLPEIPAVETASPAVLVVFDEFPLLTLLDSDGAIDGQLFPNLAALAGEATFFRNATSVAARTAHAVPSILTGRFPRADVAPTNSLHPENLFSLLQSTHRIHAFEAVTSLCPPAACPEANAHRGSRWQLLDDAARIWRWSLTRAATGSAHPLGSWFSKEWGQEEARFEKFLASIDGVGTPFHFLHVILPHAPWQFLPDGLRYPPRDLGLVDYDERTDEEWPALVDRQRHLLQVMYVDTLVGRMVDQLRAVGLYERATLLVTADHGISFEPGVPQGTRNLAPETAHEIAWVPFLLKSPGQTVGAVSDDNVMTVDVAPTLAALAGSPLPWPVDGISLGDTPARIEAKVWFNRPGEALAIDTDLSYSRVLAGGAHAAARPEEGAEGMFKVGPLAGMIGATLDEFEVTPDPRAAGRVWDLASFDDVDAESGIVPALVSGHVELPPGEARPAAVVITLNGTVAAVSDLYAEGDQAHRFAALVSPRFMATGKNSLGLFLLEGAGSERLLRRIEVHPAQG